MKVPGQKRTTLIKEKKRDPNAAFGCNQSDAVASATSRQTGAKEAFLKDPVSQIRIDFAVVRYRICAA